MNLNKVDEMTLEELKTIQFVIQEKLAEKFNLFSHDQRVKVTKGLRYVLNRLGTVVGKQDNFILVVLDGMGNNIHRFFSSELTLIEGTNVNLGKNKLKVYSPLKE